MKDVKIIIDGKEYTAQMSDEQIKEIVQAKRTGYEIVKGGELYYVMKSNGTDIYHEGNGNFSRVTFNNGNYINDSKLCRDRFRARVLHDRLEQWQALNDEPVDWGEGSAKYIIIYDYKNNSFDIDSWYDNRFIGTVYFSSEEKAQEAIEAFRDELMWYFIKYRSRLDEKRTEAGK